MIEIYLLEQLVAVYENETLSAAADKVHISQPALSRSMKKIEEQIGVPLFERTKNSIKLNDNGKMRAEYRMKILKLESQMIEHIQRHDHNSKKVIFGSCALSPTIELTKLLKELYNNMDISSEIQNEEVLLQGLREDGYSFIILTHPVDEKNLANTQWQREQLYLTVPKKHCLADRQSIELKELNGMNILAYSHLGFWHGIMDDYAPDATIVTHDSYEVFNQLIQSSSWPVLQTNFSIDRRKELADRINIPITDPQAQVDYYCVYKKKKSGKFSVFLSKLAENRQR